MVPLGHAKLQEQPFIHHLRLWPVVLLTRKKADQPDLQRTKSQPVPVDVEARRGELEQQEALPCEDKSSESISYSTWAHQLSTALQLGNAGAIYNIPRGNRAQARPLGDVETDLPPRHKQRDATALIRSNSDTDTDSVPGEESDSGSEGTESDSGGDGGESTESRMR